jgi:hypothetical protein
MRSLHTVVEGSAEQPATVAFAATTQRRPAQSPMLRRCGDYRLSLYTLFVINL